jgi:hypothetical protein
MTKKVDGWIIVVMVVLAALLIANLMVSGTIFSKLPLTTDDTIFYDATYLAPRTPVTTTQILEFYSGISGDKVFDFRIEVEQGKPLNFPSEIFDVCDPNTRNIMANSLLGQPEKREIVLEQLDYNIARCNNDQDGGALTGRAILDGGGGTGAEMHCGLKRPIWGACTPSGCPPGEQCQINLGPTCVCGNPNGDVCSNDCPTYPNQFICFQSGTQTSYCYHNAPFCECVPEVSPDPPDPDDVT